MLLLGPLLQIPSDNPHASLVTLFMNAVKEVQNHSSDRSKPNMDFLNHCPTIRNTIMSSPMDVATMGIGMLVLMALDGFGRDVEKSFRQ